MRRWPERVCGFAVVDPKNMAQALAELDRCLDAGMLGVGELNPYGQGISFDDPNWLRLMEACIERDVPVNLHVSEEVGHFYLGKTTTPMRHYYRLAARYPELKLILAHWGGGLFFYEIMPEVQRTLKNVWYDTAGTPLLYPTGAIFKHALQFLDHRKILYGSDYPLLVLPKRQKAPDFSPFIEEIEMVEMSPGVYEDIMGLNAARLLKFVAAPAAHSSAATAGVGGSSAPAAIITEIAQPEGRQIEPYMAVAAVAAAWPQTRAVFDRHGIPYQDQAVPDWEPVAQAAAARGLGPTARKKLLDELNEAAGLSGWTGSQDEN